MLKAITMAVLLAVLVIPQSAAREPTDGVSLWTGCSTNYFSRSYYESYAACRAYITGVADVLSSGDKIAGHTACIPDTASKADITERVIGWLEANPVSRQGRPAHVLVAEAISTAYPCK